MIHASRVPPDGFERLLDGFAPDPHPMGTLIASFARCPRTIPNRKRSSTSRRAARRSPSHRTGPALAAYAFRHRRGRPIVRPSEDLSFSGNFLAMLFSEPGTPYMPHPVLERALDVLFILHADHEQNCSTFAMRSVGSSHTDPFSSAAGAGAALYGPLHGGANEAVLRMLNEIGAIEHVPEFIAAGQGG